MYSKHLAESVAERTGIRTEYIKICTKGIKTPNYKNVPWKRYIVTQSDGQVVGWRAIFYKQKEIHYQRGKLSNEAPEGEEEDGDGENGHDEGDGDVDGDDDGEPVAMQPPPKKRKGAVEDEGGSSSSKGRGKRAKKGSRK